VADRPAPGAHGAIPTEPLTSDMILEAVLTSLDDDKAEDIVQIDLRGKSAMADAMVIATGRSSRQVAAISEKLVDRLKQAYGLHCKIEGKDTGDWVLIDTGDVVVHCSARKSATSTSSKRCGCPDRPSSNAPGPCACISARWGG